MSDDQPNNVAMSIGELKGLVSGVTQMLTNQNISAADNKKEMMGFLKSTYDSLQEHIKEDTVINSAVIQLTKWQTDVDPKVNTLWDTQNRQKGWLLATGSISGIIGAGIVALVEFFKK